MEFPSTGNLLFWFGRNSWKLLLSLLPAVLLILLKEIHLEIHDKLVDFCYLILEFICDLHMVTCNVLERIDVKYKAIIESQVVVK